MIPVQTKATSADKSGKGNNSEAFLSASHKSSEIGSIRDFINMEKIENEDNAWKWICEVRVRVLNHDLFLYNFV